MTSFKISLLSALCVITVAYATNGTENDLISAVAALRGNTTVTCNQIGIKIANVLDKCLEDFVTKKITKAIALKTLDQLIQIAQENQQLCPQQVEEAIALIKKAQEIVKKS